MFSHNKAHLMISVWYCCLYVFLIFYYFIIPPPAYEAYRGYIVFAFSVYMFVCECVFVNFFLSKISRKLLDLGL